MNEAHVRFCSSPEWASYVAGELLPWVLASYELGDDVLEIGPGPGLTTDLLRQMVPPADRRRDRRIACWAASAPACRHQRYRGVWGRQTAALRGCSLQRCHAVHDAASRAIKRPAGPVACRSPAGAQAWRLACWNGGPRHSGPSRCARRRRLCTGRPGHASRPSNCCGVHGSGGRAGGGPDSFRCPSAFINR